MFKNKGFTLIELLLVIGILGILSAALLATLDPFSQFQKGNDAKRKSDLSQIQKALESYYQDNGTYPPSSSYKIVNNNAVLDWGDSFTPYMNLLPKDPGSPSKTYIYSVSSDRQSYYLYASLERGNKDPQSCGGACQNVPGSDDNICGGVCNYGVTSPDQEP